MFSTNLIKRDFPIFKKNPNFVYLDSTATSLKPQSVIDKISEYYTDYSANVARGLYKISEKATEEYEETRGVVAKFINAKSFDEIVFTRSATESINLIAYALGRNIVGPGDNVVFTVMEHHSNFVPWQMLAIETGAEYKVIEIYDDGSLNITPRAGGESDIKMDNILNKKSKILAITYISNVLGTVNPIKKIIAEAKRINPHIIVVVDGAQAIPHMKVDVQDLGCDFFVFSSHKMLGPTGVGVMWGKYELLKEMPAFNFGGEMIDEVAILKTTFKNPPHKFEAGTPHIDGVIAFKEAIRYLQAIGMDSVQEHEKKITHYAMKRLIEEFGSDIKLFGPQGTEKKGGIISFSFFKFHPHDIAQILDEEDIAVRAGHHCAMPLHTRLGIPASTRASFYIYNGEEDVEKLVEGLKKVRAILL